MAHDISRRDLLGVVPVSFVTPLLAQQRATPRPFRVSIPRPTIDRILNRVKETRLPDRLDAPDWRYGANWAFMKALTEYWTTAFDWRKAEANLNRYPQFVARLDDFDIHFYDARGGHLACLEQPQLFVEDVRAFFRRCDRDSSAHFTRDRVSFRGDRKHRRITEQHDDITTLSLRYTRIAVTFSRWPAARCAMPSLIWRESMARRNAVAEPPKCR